jgi:hypothetical protein
LSFVIREGGAVPRPPSLPALRPVGRWLAWAFAAATFAIATAASPVLGHEGGPRLVLEPDRVSPRGVLTIRLEDLPPEGRVELSIAGATGSVPLASIVVDPEGHATVYVEVPVGLPVGSYTVNATAGDVAVAGVSVTVEGAPVGLSGEPGEKAEEDLLLVALPSGWQQSLSGPIVTARPLTETLPAGSGTRLATEGIIVAIAVAVGLGSVALVLGTRLRRRA